MILFLQLSYPTSISFYSRLANNPREIVALNAIASGCGQLLGGFMLSVVGGRSSMRRRKAILASGLFIEVNFVLW